MSNYRFEVVRNEQPLGDAWVELDRPDEIRREALKALHDIAIDEMASSDLDETLSISVHDEEGRPHYSATLSVSQPLAGTRKPPNDYKSAEGEALLT
jgi:exoribonuclease II